VSALGSEELALNDQERAERRRAVASAWQKWLLLFIPLFAIEMAGMYWFGFGLVMPVMLALLIAVLLYQRIINRRSWRSILWGIHVSEK